ncbi:MAG: hypothetical protein NTX75_07985 [Proteobacteria bacterium]|nr:hypothetical protein [Pseudomonadota bacterium]
MKVSKPVIFTLVFAVGIILYLFVFSGKNPPPVPAPKPQAGQAVPAQPQGAATGVPGALQTLLGAPQPAAGAENPKLRAQVYAKLNDAAWGRDPFAFPGYVEERLNEQQSKGSARLVAIIKGRNGKVAIIDNEVVKKGDMIGSEKVQEIGDDTVVLIKKGVKRVITIEETPATDIEIKVKKRGK